jgi:hypothetical protein
MESSFIIIRTATAEGQIMAQVMSTFSRLEQSRFEAFRRATFPQDVIAKYVAHCLMEEQHRPISKGILSGTTIPLSSSSLLSSPAGQHREPILSELVAPGQAEDIALIVSILAKAYAQRLVTAACRHATIRCASTSTTTNTTTGKEEGITTSSTTSLSLTNNNINNNMDHSSITMESTTTPPTTIPTTTSANTVAMAITPQDLLNAYEERKAQGLDPGFFLQPWNQSQHNILGVVSSNHNYNHHNNYNRGVYQRKRLATMFAQQQYNKVVQHCGDKMLLSSPPQNDEDEEQQQQVQEFRRVEETERINQENSDMMTKIFHTI